MRMATQTAQPGGIAAPDEGLAAQIRVAVPERSLRSGPTVDQEAVVLVLEWLDPVDVGGEHDGRLRFTHGQEMSHIQATEWIDRSRVP